MSFLPEQIITKYFLLLKPPIGRPEGSLEEKPNKIQREKIEKWLMKKFLNFPHIPDLFFESYDEQIKNKKTPLDVFSSINYELNRLEKYKVLILQNLDGLKNQFTSINVNKSLYQIDSSSKDNAFPLYIINDPMIFTKLFNNSDGRYYFFPNFVKYVYMKNNCSLIKYKGSKKETPFFAEIFNDEYNGEVKQFIMELFKEYIQIRNGLLKKIDKYYGIIAFKSIFDFKTKDIISIEKKIKSKNNFNSNFEAVKIYNEQNMSENLNYNSSYESFLSSSNLSNKTKSKNKLSNEQKIKLKESYKFMTLRPNDNIYKNLGNENIFYETQNNNLMLIFNKMIDLIKKIYTIQFINLYEFMITTIELDFVTIQFIFNFVRSDLFLKALQTKKEIYRFINANINLYYNYIEEFDIWIYNYLLKYNIEPFSTGDEKFEEVYKSFYQFITSMFDKTKEQRNENFVNELNNEGVFVSVPNSNSKINDNIMSKEELNEYTKLKEKLK